MPKKTGKENTGPEKLEINKSFYLFDRKKAEKAIGVANITLPAVIDAIRESTRSVNCIKHGFPISDINFSGGLGDVGKRLWEEGKVLLQDVKESDIESIRNRGTLRAPENISEAIIMVFGFSGDVAENIRNAEKIYNENKRASVAKRLGPRQRTYEEGRSGKSKSDGWEL